jgi:hypothetical protein
MFVNHDEKIASYMLVLTLLPQSRDIQRRN